SSSSILSDSKPPVGGRCPAAANTPGAMTSQSEAIATRTTPPPKENAACRVKAGGVWDAEVRRLVLYDRRIVGLLGRVEGPAQAHLKVVGVQVIEFHRVVDRV